MKNNSLILIGLWIAIISSGCGARQPASLPSDATETFPPPAATQPPTPLPTVSPTLLPIPSPTLPITTANITASMLNLRSGPSTLHAILGQYPKNTTVTLLGAAPGYEWLKIQAPDGKVGWMSTKLLETDQDLHLLPTLSLTESLMLTGKVTDAAGKGIPFITVSMTKIGADVTVHAEGITGEDGIFFIFSPAEYQGSWSVQVVDIDCKSPIMDPNCSYQGGFTPAGGFTTNLPQDTAIVFTYRTEG